jgi:hypothetical protein
LATAPGVNLLAIFGSGEPDAPMPYLGVVAMLVHGMDTYTPIFSAERTLTPQAAVLRGSRSGTNHSAIQFDRYDSSERWVEGT